jgi:hypothetical protein
MNIIELKTGDEFEYRGEWYTILSFEINALRCQMQSYPEKIVVFTLDTINRGAWLWTTN